MTLEIGVIICLVITILATGGMIGMILGGNGGSKLESNGERGRRAMEADGSQRPGYYSTAKDWVGTRQPGDLTIAQWYDVADELDNYLEPAYNSLDAQQGGYSGRPNGGNANIPHNG